MRGIPAGYVAALVAIVIAVAYAVYRSRSKQCKDVTDCPAGEACVAGACAPPGCGAGPACAAPAVCVGGTCLPPDPASCYVWTPWTPGVQKGAPSWAMGAGFLVPVGVQDANGQWGLGATVGDPSENDYGQYIPGTAGSSSASGTYYALQASGTCPGKIGTTADPAIALQFHGTPVCYSTNNMFTSYKNGKCDDSSGMGPWGLVQNATS